MNHMTPGFWEIDALRSLSCRTPRILELGSDCAARLRMRFLGPKTLLQFLCEVMPCGHCLLRPPGLRKGIRAAVGGSSRGERRSKLHIPGQRGVLVRSRRVGAQTPSYGISQPEIRPVAAGCHRHRPHERRLATICSFDHLRAISDLGRHMVGLETRDRRRGKGSDQRDSWWPLGLLGRCPRKEERPMGKEDRQRATLPGR